MSNKNLSLNKANWKKLDELMKQTNQSTRQAAVTEVLDKAGKCDYWKENAELSRGANKTTRKACEYYRNKCQSLEQTINNYRWIVVVLATVVIAGWVL